MRATIYQPQYFPRLHFFNRIINSDVFVILSSAQYTKNLNHIKNGIHKRHKSYQSDSPIRYPSGVYYLTIPINHSGLRPLNETTIAYPLNWVNKHLSIIKTFYKKSAYFKNIFPTIENILSYRYQNLADLNIKTILWGISQLAGFRLSFGELKLDVINNLLSSSKLFRLRNIFIDYETGVTRPEGAQKGTEWTAEICKKLEATEYYHGETAKQGYMDTSYYIKKGIKPVSQNWHCAKYEQQFSDNIGFIPNLSIVDLLNNLSTKQALGIIGIEKNKSYAFDQKTRL